MKSLALFNNKGGVGKTTLTFNIAHMLARKGLRTVALDYDPQCNLSAIFLSDEELVELWEKDGPGGTTVVGCIDLIRRGKGEMREPILQEVADNLWLLPGHLSLSQFEQRLAEEWPKVAAHDNERALDVTCALDLLSNLAAAQVDADVVLIDVGPSLGALNRAALLSCDAVVVPLAPDLFSLQGLANVGPMLREWRHDWEQVCTGSRLKNRPQESLPVHTFQPIGYIVQQHLARADRIPSGYQKWAAQIPYYFHHYVLDEPNPPKRSIETDEECIALIKHFASLVPTAQLARKPIFDLKQAHGIGGGQIQAVARVRREFKELVDRLTKRLQELPDAMPAGASASKKRKKASTRR